MFLCVFSVYDKRLSNILVTESIGQEKILCKNPYMTNGNRMELPQISRGKGSELHILGSKGALLSGSSRHSGPV